MTCLQYYQSTPQQEVKVQRTKNNIHDRKDKERIKQMQYWCSQPCQGLFNKDWWVKSGILLYTNLPLPFMKKARDFLASTSTKWR